MLNRGWLLPLVETPGGSLMARTDSSQTGGRSRRFTTAADVELPSGSGCERWRDIEFKQSGRQGAAFWSGARSQPRRGGGWRGRI